ncbi:MAG: tetratricopeptide repeat protein [Hydrogenothermaceae bacterium]|nr:tetratricopeptide repeat protein [Hydrogenothermaceae bacterium]
MKKASLTVSGLLILSGYSFGEYTLNRKESTKNYTIETKDFILNILNKRESTKNYTIETKDFILNILNKRESTKNYMNKGQPHDEVEHKKTVRVVDEELLKLLLIALLGKNDIESAYDVAKKGIELFPDKEYWWEQYGKIAVWSGRTVESFTAYQKIFEINPSRENVLKLFRISLLVNRFDITSNLLERYDFLFSELKDIKDMVYIFKKSGKIEEFIKLLSERYKKEKNPEYLYHIASLFYDVGNIQESLKFIRELEEKRSLKINEIIFYSSILYILKRPVDSFNVLSRYEKFVLSELSKGNKDNLKDVLEYYQTFSDLAWFLKEYEKAIYTSKILDEVENGRLIDYIRLCSFFSSKKDYKTVLEYARKGYKKYKNSYLLSAYVESLYRLKDWNSIVTLSSEEDIKEQLLKDIYLFSLYNRALVKSWKRSEALKNIKTILKQNPSEEFISESIFLAIESSDKDIANYILSNLKKYENSLPKQFAILYLFLQNTKDALNLLSKVDKNNLEDLLLFADILQNYGRVEEAQRIKYQIFRELSKEDIFNLDSSKIEFYLKVGIDFLSGSSLDKLFKIAKERLEPEVYEDIYFSYILKLIKQEKLLYILEKHKKTLRPWMYLNLSLWMDDRYWQGELLEKFGDILPIRDRVEALRRTGQIKKAGYYAFKGLEENREDFSLYKQFRDLIYSNYSKIENSLSYTSWDRVENFRENLFIRYYFEKGLYFNYDFLDVFKIKNSNPNYTNIGLKFHSFRVAKQTDKRKIETGASYIDGVEESTGFVFRYTEYLGNRTSLDLFTGFNQLSYESLYMFFGGMKDSYSLSLTHNLNNRASFYLSSIYDVYKSQDEKKIGYGNTSYGETSYKVRIGYPDYTFRLYLQNSNFNEKNTDKGSINKVSSKQNPDVLPPSYGSVGIGFLFGLDNRDNYVRVWRPFFSADIVLNSRTGLGYGLSAGIGGTFFRQDNLSTGLKYIQDFKGTTASFWEYYFKYLLLF